MSDDESLKHQFPQGVMSVRRLSSVLLTVFLLVFVSLPASAASGLPILLDGKDTGVTLDAATGLAPVEPLAKALGADFAWNAARREATLVLGLRSVVLTADSNRAIASGVVRTLPTPARLIDGAIHAPALAVAESLGFYALPEAGELELVSAWGLLSRLKNPDMTKDLMLTTSMVTRGTMTAPGADPESESFAWNTFLHVYKQEMLMAITMEMPSEPAMEIIMAFKDGKAYVKEPALGWIVTDESSPLGIPGAFDMDESTMPAADSEELQGALMTITGTSEMDGVRVVHVLASMTESPLSREFAGVMLGGLDGPESYEIKQYLFTYAIDPLTGNLHHGQMEMVMAMTDSTGRRIESAMEVEIRSNPVSQPIQFPADLPK